MKILILTGRFGSGHTAAAAALEQDLRTRLPGSNIRAVDLPDWLDQTGAAVLYGAFGLMVRRMSPLYNAYYKLSALQGAGGKSLSPLRVFIRKTEELLAREKPDVVVSTHPACAFLAGCCKMRGWPFTTVTCLTDLSTHPEWVNEGTDLYCVGHRDIALALRGQGVAEEQILTTGVPLRQEFYAPAAGSRGPGQELLLMGGGLGLLPPEPAFYRGLAALPGVHTTVVTGKNQKLYQRLAGRYEGLTVLGYVDNVGELMASADLMVSKAGGLTLFESLFRALPLLVPEPTLQQEVHNAAWAEAHGVAAVAPRDPEGCLDAIVRLLADRNGLERMSKAAGQVCRTLEPHGLARCLKGLEKEGGRHAA